MTIPLGKAGISGALWLAAAMAGWPSGREAPSPAGATNTVSAPAPLAIVHGPLLQAPSETGMTVSWATSRRCVSWVEYRAEGASSWRTHRPAHHGLVDADVTHHNVVLTGLKAGEGYVYRAVSREIVEFKPYQVTFGETVTSAEHRFRTLDPAKATLRFVVLNDRHEKVEALAASLASVAWSRVDVVFLNGDMVNDAKDEHQLYRCVVDPCVDHFAAQIPLVYVRGNHDARGSFARRLLDYFPTESGRYYYTLRHGPVAFLVLDSGEDKTDQSAEYSGLVAFEPYLEAQVRWLARQVEATDFQRAPFRVCFLHIPPLPRPDPKFVRPQWLVDHVVPLLNRGRVDLLICAHTHRYAVQQAGRNGLNFPMIIGGTETVLECDATAGELRVRAVDLSGKPLRQLEPIRRRTGG